jgi:hypothetical protein
MPGFAKLLEQQLWFFSGFIALISHHEDTTTFLASILGEFVGPLSGVQRPIGVGTKGEIFFLRKDEELVWLDFGHWDITLYSKWLANCAYHNYCQVN